MCIFSISRYLQVCDGRFLDLVPFNWVLRVVFSWKQIVLKIFWNKTYLNPSSQFSTITGFPRNFWKKIFKKVHLLPFSRLCVTYFLNLWLIVCLLCTYFLFKLRFCTGPCTYLHQIIHFNLWLGLEFWLFTLRRLPLINMPIFCHPTKPNSHP